MGRSWISDRRLSILLTGVGVVALFWLGAASAMAGVDGDGDADVVFANFDENRVCLNDGAGNLTCTDLSSATNASAGMAVGLVDGDDDPDLVIANLGHPDRVCLNDGAGAFSCSDVSTDTFDGLDVALGDIDGDTDLDAVFANTSAQPNRVCLNDGAGGFACSDVSPDTAYTRGVALGDVDGDTDLDLVFANQGTSRTHERNRVCLGDGSGGFACNDVSTDEFSTNGVALGDVDGDTDLDIVFANGEGGQVDQPNRVCLGDGAGVFSCMDASADLGIRSLDVELGYINGDRHLDAFFANFVFVNWACLGDGTGSFTCSDVNANPNSTQAVALGFIDGDAYLDAVLANQNEANEMCLGDGTGAFTCGTADTEGYLSLGVAIAPAGSVLVEDQVDDLVDTVESMELHQGTENSLTKLLDNSLKSYLKGDIAEACEKVESFIDQVNAYEGKKLTSAEAVILRSAVLAVAEDIGC